MRYTRVEISPMGASRFRSLMKGMMSYSLQLQRTCMSMINNVLTFSFFFGITWVVVRTLGIDRGLAVIAT